MTYQSSPYSSWIFPDEAYHMNIRGIGKLKPLPINNGFDLLPGGGSEAQTLFDNHDNKVALERVRMNKKKEQGMLGHLKTTERAQRYERPASRSAVSNGVFSGSEYVTSSGLRGGVITTPEGQEWLAKRLKQRAVEYGQLSSGNYSAGPPARIELSSYTDIDILLRTAFTALTTGSFTGGLNDALNQLIQAFIKNGAVLTPRQLTTYAQAVSKMVVVARSYSEATRVAEFEQGELDVKRFFKLETIQETLKILDATIREIARVINEPKSTREQVMSTLSSRLIGRQLEQFIPGEQGSKGTTPPFEMGQVPEQSTELLPPQRELAPDASEVPQWGEGRHRMRF